MGLTVDLVEPFFAGSHRAWAEGWATASVHTVRLHTLPGTAWRWRMRGAAATLAPSLVEQCDIHGRPDLLVATDMIDLSGLLAQLRSTHADVPVALYLHENQLTYPRRPGEALETGLAWTTWNNLVVADEIWCNSAFHRDELLAALPGFLDAVPDHPHTDRLDAVAARIRILPVGVDLVADGARADPPLVLSNQRWHHDKDIGAVVRALRSLAENGAEFRLAMLGDHRGGMAEQIDPLLDQLGSRVVARGLQDRSDYERWLGAADIVVSAARNEFFGIAVVEAVSAGAVPVLPDDVAYPEVIPAAYHDQVLYRRGELRPALAAALAELPQRRRATEGLATAMTRFSWTELGPHFDEAAQTLVESMAGRQ